jgi:hypothetical protein
MALVLLGGSPKARPSLDNANDRRSIKRLTNTEIALTVSCALLNGKIARLHEALNIYPSLGQPFTGKGD